MAVIAKSRSHAGLLAAFVIALLTAATPVYCGDEDRGSAYKIYIDPETGKYTTEEPGAFVRSDSVVMPPPQSPPAKRSSPVLLVTGAGALLVLFAVVAVRRRRNSKL